MAICEFDGGRTACFYASRTQAHGHETVSEVFGTAGRLVVGRDGRLTQVEIADAHGIRTETTPTFYERFADAFLRELAHFVDCVRHDRAPGAVAARRDRGDAHRHRASHVARRAAGGGAVMDRYQFAGELAREAGRIAHRGFGPSASSMKGRHDVVTEMDREVERFIRAAIEKAFPGDAIIGEEEGGGSEGERLWIIDPIDGTANYARGIPHYCVSIGYLEHGVPTRRGALRPVATTGCTRRARRAAPASTARGSRSAPAPT